MIGFTKKSDYALVALAGLAQSGVGADQPVSARQLAASFGLSPDLVTKLLKDLHRGGVVESTRGVHGGYYLARPPARITVAQVIEALEGPVQLTDCCNDQGSDCGVMEQCPVTGRVRQLNERIHRFLSQVTLEDLLRDELPPLPIALTIEPALLTASRP